MGKEVQHVYRGSITFILRIHMYFIRCSTTDTHKENMYTLWSDRLKGFHSKEYIISIILSQWARLLHCT